MAWWWLPSAAWDASRRSWREDEPAPPPQRRKRRYSSAKLTDAQVAEIRALGGQNRAGNASLAEHPSYADLARRFGVSKSLIRAVVKGRRYQEVT